MYMFKSSTSKLRLTTSECFKLGVSVIILFILPIGMANTKLSPAATGNNGRLIVDENEYDPPIKLCGPRLAEKVKERCGKRGIYAPNEPYRRFNNVHTVYQVLLRSVRRQTGGLCDYYKMYEPENVVTQCCCLGCTRWYLEQLCNPA
ncbi:hypothetical protein PHET_01533 [Paragonimus heterotremus]|uniref:Insulin-like domain-containing protein n=1 Tax=Paragonimus heterotremus TaxID=100268 RepID=A0A8J4THH4_9TREM|nr:hypothetical protein PHET_01533 [Paragonimus heterotremus]